MSHLTHEDENAVSAWIPYATGIKYKIIDLRKSTKQRKRRSTVLRNWSRLENGRLMATISSKRKTNITNQLRVKRQTPVSRTGLVNIAMNTTTSWTILNTCYRIKKRLNQEVMYVIINISVEALTAVSKLWALKASDTRRTSSWIKSKNGWNSRIAAVIT